MMCISVAKRHGVHALHKSMLSGGVVRWCRGSFAESADDHKHHDSADHVVSGKGRGCFPLTYGFVST